ncbi:MAG TPA: hypothetical protein VLU54_10235 [Casimicrobiaceae bacterium]|nr:hypothetical protein [Casimicrobiaceae bacterium]
MIAVHDTTNHLHPVVARSARRKGSSSRKQILTSRGDDVFPAEVSPGQKDRALRILDGIVRSLVAAGATLVPATPGGLPVHLAVLGQFVSFRIDELFERTLRERPRSTYSVEKPEILGAGYCCERFAKESV